MGGCEGVKKGPGNREVGRAVKWGKTLWHDTEFRLLGSEMAQRGKALASKHSNLFDPMDPGVEGENQRLKVVLWPVHVTSHYTHIRN